VKPLPDHVRCYAVGGAVRDALLGRPATDRDWVVVGATPDDMQAAGFKPVGRDFPVFLHPDTAEEYALARTERKSGRGYRGFVVDADPGVTLEEDLARRDLTINAIAQAADGALVDPWGGRADLDARRLRHVSAAFAEDPLRVLRVARFHARLAPLGFEVCPETLELMRRITASGELLALSPERVWKETERALTESTHPSVYFTTLRACDALAVLMPEIEALFGVPQRADYHPEVDTGVHVMMAIDVAARDRRDLPVRVATLLHDLGKACTPDHVLPGHRGHEEAGVPLVDAFCERLRLPNACRDLARVVTREHLNVHRAREVRPGTLHDLIERLGAFRKDDRFESALLACLCDAQGRLGFEDAPYPPVEWLRGARDTALGVGASSVVADGFSGVAVGTELRRRRIEALTGYVRAKREGDRTAS